jgi:aspartate/methionine/tyrosine aminotransferase
VYGAPYQKLASVIGEVPGIAMRGISKEFPWPGARCGWVEFYNRDKDDDFYAFTKSLIDLKMLEVCSTSLPQKLIPKVMADKRYFPYLKERILGYKDRSEIAYDILSRIPEVIIHKPQGAFYMTLVFKEGVLNEHQTLAIQSGEIKKLVESLVSSAMPLDKRFVYYLLGATGICVVPLQSGFNSTYCGFRFTVLNPDDASFSKTIEALSEALRAYIAS